MTDSRVLLHSLHWSPVGTLCVLGPTPGAGDSENGIDKVTEVFMKPESGEGT